MVTVRLRMQMVPQPPYIRNVTFTLMGVPKVEISAIPMSKLVSHPRANVDEPLTVDTCIF